MGKAVIKVKRFCYMAGMSVVVVLLMLVTVLAGVTLEQLIRGLF